MCVCVCAACIFAVSKYRKKVIKSRRNGRCRNLNCTRVVHVGETTNRLSIDEFID